MSGYSKTQDDVTYIVVKDTVEHEDGSATYQFNTSEEGRQMFAELGMRLVFYCAAVGKSTEEVLEGLFKD